MLFHSFATQEDRRAFGGGDFIELQYCRKRHTLPMEALVSEDRITHWQNDSLYLCGDDWDTFCAAYGDIITGGTYSNLSTGDLDWCGINYFSPLQAAAIGRMLQEKQPPEYETLLRWLDREPGCNGFYVLGL